MLHFFGTTGLKPLQNLTGPPFISQEVTATSLNLVSCFSPYSNVNYSISSPLFYAKNNIREKLHTCCTFYTTSRNHTWGIIFT